jgi:hypothetical protein
MGGTDDDDRREGKFELPIVAEAISARTITSVLHLMSDWE